MATDLRRKNAANVFSNSLFYQQILIYVFGFYGIWGHILSKLIFAAQVSSSSLLERISVSITILAVPFMVAAWWFLFHLGSTLLNLKRKALYSSLMLVGSLILSGTILFFQYKLPVLDISFSIFMIENVLLAAYTSMAVLISKSSVISTKNKIRFILVIIVFAMLVTTSAYFYNEHKLIAGTFILFFFIANTWLSFTFRYLIKCPEIKEPETPLTFDTFCEKYGISNRESEIIQLICEGLTNKDIADKLFITLQTVKDHTSRIYLKTEVKNRTQLANLARSFASEN